MDNNLQTWNYENSEIRTVEKDGEPWFVGKDVAAVLGYAKPENAIARHVDDEDKSITPFQGTAYETRATIINESGLYSLILSSKLPNAKKFKRWVTNEVLPSIRKHGAYMTDQTLEQALTSPDFLIQLATQLKEEKEAGSQGRAGPTKSTVCGKRFRIENKHSGWRAGKNLETERRGHRADTIICVDA